MSGLFHLLFVVIHIGILLLVENEVMGLSYDPHSGLLWVSLALHYATNRLLKGRIPKHGQEENISYPSTHRDLRNLHAPGKQLSKRR